MNYYFLLIVLFILNTCLVFSQNTKVIVGGTLINTHEKTIIKDPVIIIKDGKILDVGSSKKIKIPKEAQIIDAKGKYIIPGLFDTHIHFFQSGGLYTRPDAIDLNHRRPYLEEVKWIKDNIDDVLKRYLACGVTTVYDFGGPMWNFDVRKHSKETEFSPRVFLSGPLIASYQPDALSKVDDLPIIKVNTKEEALKLISEQKSQNTDFIKVWYVVTKNKHNSLNEFYPIVKAIVDESHKLGLPVFIHATELETARKAVEAGCDGLAHIITDTIVDSDFLKLCKKNNVIIVPTIRVFESYKLTFQKQLGLLKYEQLMGNPKIIGSLLEMHELQNKELSARAMRQIADTIPSFKDSVTLKNLKLIHNFGITVAVGTDAGNIGVLHGPTVIHELMMMNRAGISEHDLIICATINSAKLLNKENELGSIEKDKYADILLLNSNPLENIVNCSDISMVIKNGNTFIPNDIIKRSPEDLAQLQLNAYNSRDIESFIEAYSDSVEVYDFPNIFAYKGKEQMKTLYTEFFKKAPKLHCKLVNRIIQGNVVIDREFVTGIPGRENLNATAIYEIKDGKIAKVWFVR